MYSPLSVSREWEVVMNGCGVEDYSSVMRWLVVGAVCEERAVHHDKPTAPRREGTSAFDCGHVASVTATNQLPNTRIDPVCDLLCNEMHTRRLLYGSGGDCPRRKTPHTAPPWGIGPSYNFFLCFTVKINKNCCHQTCTF